MAKRWWLPALAVGLLASGGAHAEELKCAGPFAKDADHARLVTTFGRANVARETLYEEGSELKASVVFPKDPVRRIEITWWDEKGYRRPSSIQAKGAGWTGPNGLGVNASLSDVETANGRPFSLYGFGWDYGGTVSDWKGGAFATIPGDCNLIVVFGSDESADESALRKVSNDNEFGSDTPEIKAVKPRVERIGVAYPKNR